MTEHCRLRLHLDIKYVGELILKFSSKMNGGDMFNKLQQKVMVTQTMRQMLENGVQGNGK